MTKTRLLAWLLLGAVVYGGVSIYRNWSNPWAVVKSPVLSILPASAPGCGEGCKP